MVFDIGMPNIAVNLLDGAFEMVKHKKETSRVGETRPCQRFKGGLNSTESLRIVERDDVRDFYNFTPLLIHFCCAKISKSKCIDFMSH